MPGKVTLVGAGPGDPGLLTRKGLEALERADVVVYDRLVSPAILALMPEGAVKINVGKEASRHPVPQEQINRILLEQAQQGHNVVRLKGVLSAFRQIHNCLTPAQRPAVHLVRVARPRLVKSLAFPFEVQANAPAPLPKKAVFEDRKHRILLAVLPLLLLQDVDVVRQIGHVPDAGHLIRI